MGKQEITQNKSSFFIKPPKIRNTSILLHIESISYYALFATGIGRYNALSYLVFPTCNQASPHNYNHQANVGTFFYGLACLTDNALRPFIRFRSLGYIHHLFWTLSIVDRLWIKRYLENHYHRK